jgi:hypothetical protein
MSDLPHPIGIRDTAIESRDFRFAELDAQIEAEESSRKERPSIKQLKRYRIGHGLPREVRQEIARCAQQVRKHRKLFVADPKLKDRVARFLRSLLPPRRKRGRPGIASVTEAILLLKKLRREFPQEDQRQLWQRVYPEVIPHYGSLPREQQRGQEMLLREQVRSRGNQRRRRETRVHSQSNRPQLRKEAAKWLEFAPKRRRRI